MDDDELGDMHGCTDEDKRKRRQERHRILERQRRDKTQGLLNLIHLVSHECI